MEGLLEGQFPAEESQLLAWFEEEAVEDLILQTLIINFYQVIPVGEVVELYLEDVVEAQF